MISFPEGEAATRPVTPSAFSGLIGFGRSDITPPVGIHATGTWGASRHERSIGTHRPLYATALAVRAGASQPAAVLVSIDHEEFGDLATGESGLVASVLSQLGLSPSQLMISCSHAHSAPWLAKNRVMREGGDLLESYLDALQRGIVTAARSAVAAAVPATLTWGTGCCDLATNRDLRDPDRSKERLVCGYNPAGGADDTVLVGRVTRDRDGSVIGTIVNYACHPTTLGWDNKLVSPDFVGAMRELVENATTGAPCAFLQGASGELAPALQYVTDPAVADRHGRRLGFSVLETLEGMLEPGYELVFDQVVESGAPLAVWTPRRFRPDRAVRMTKVDIEYALKRLPDPDELAARASVLERPWEAERLVRMEAIVRSLGAGPTYSTPAWVWRVGGCFFVGHPNEAYSTLQHELRATFPGHAVVVMNLVNDGSVVAYLTPEALQKDDVYTVWQSPFDGTSLARLTDSCREAMGAFFG